MDSPSTLALHPALLPPGSVLGSWRVQAWAGGGAHGAVYRAVPHHNEHASRVALKLALLPEDPRFARERELLSRSHHPSIPCLVDQGSWQSPSGTLHPFLVLQWVDGEPLYELARFHAPAPARVRRWLAQLAQALAALHAQGAVHRDLKGDNVLVRRSDDRAILMDFGTGLYPGAVALTPAMGFPGTPLYRSPQSWLFEIQFHGSTTARYRPCAADDLYALGVTACRLLTGEYPGAVRALPGRARHLALERGAPTSRAAQQPRRGALSAQPHSAPALGAPRAARHGGATGAGVGTHLIGEPLPATCQDSSASKTRMALAASSSGGADRVHVGGTHGLR